MEKTKMISLKDAVKQSWAILTKNENIGFVFKLQFVYFLFSAILGTVILTIIIIFSLVNNKPLQPFGMPGPSNTQTSPQRFNDLQVNEPSVIKQNTSAVTVQNKYPPRNNSLYTPPGSAPLNQAQDLEMLVPSVIIFFVICIILLVVFMGVSYIYAAASVYMVLKMCKGTTEPIRSLIKSSASIIGKFAILLFLQSLLVIVGFILFIIPGVIFSIKYLFSPFIMLEENCSPVEAMKKSADLTKGFKTQLFKKLIGLTAIQLLSLLLFIYTTLFSGQGGIGGFLGILYSVLFQLVIALFYYNIKESKNQPIPVTNEPAPTIAQG